MSASVSPAMTAAGASPIGSRSIIPAASSKLVTLDIIPTYEMWHGMDDKFAMKVWHWQFLALKQPMPEMLIEKDPIGYIDYKMASWTKSKDLSCLRSARARALPRLLFRSAAHPCDLRGLSRRAHHRSHRTTKPTARPARRSPCRCARSGARRHSGCERPARDLEGMGDRRDRQRDRFRAFRRRGKSGRTAKAMLDFLRQ